MFNRFAICEAAYLFAVNYNEGQYSIGYRFFRRLHNIGFRSSPFLTLSNASQETKQAYGRLVKKYYPNQCGWKKRLNIKRDDLQPKIKESITHNI